MSALLLLFVDEICFKKKCLSSTQKWSECRKYGRFLVVDYNREWKHFSFSGWNDDLVALWFQEKSSVIPWNSWASSSLLRRLNLLFKVFEFYSNNVLDRVGELRICKLIVLVATTPLFAINNPSLKFFSIWGNVSLINSFATWHFVTEVGSSKSCFSFFSSNFS